jgi:hypothetical protein
MAFLSSNLKNEQILQGAHTAWDSSAETPHTSLEMLLITGTF